ncbi:hypothetical protein [Streptomonospora salina]|uniref:Uncharacterized protein n=1 Tax=Streptomonospora salina TaxID=104205 RepID=A0A841E5S1_9ACTN|nr:hypothetical protein [Streptomonospora salina]MBB5998132.1 hypothetical protein [Streptomonospora salina]
MSPARYSSVGVLAAPLAAYVVRLLPARVMGTLVGGLIVVTDARTFLLAFGLDAGVGPVLYTVLAGLVRRSGATGLSLPQGLPYPDRFSSSWGKWGIRVRSAPVVTPIFPSSMSYAAAGRTVTDAAQALAM